MKSKILLKLCCHILSSVVLIAARATPAHAESPQAMTLDAVVAEVLAQNPEVEFYRAEIAAAKGDAQSVGTWEYPEISTSLGDKRVTGGGTTSEGIAWSVSVQQTFEWPGRIPLRKAIANHQIQLAELGFAQFKSTLAARTRTAAFTLFAAQQKTTAARVVADRFHALREVLVQRDPAGITPQLELRIIEATEITMRRKASEAALAEQTARLELNHLRGQPWQRTLTIAPLDLTFTAAPDPDTLLAAARAHNFEIRMRQVELAQQGFKVSLAAKDQSPSFTVGPYFSQERAGDGERQIGLSLSIPLPLWDRDDGDIEAAKARQQQAQTSMTVTQRAVERQVVEQALGYQTKLDEIAKWRPESVAEFRTAADLADRHYRLGAVPITTYVELQKQYLDAVEALLDTKREALDAGQQLELLTGWDIHAVRTKP